MERFEFKNENFKIYMLLIWQAMHIKEHWEMGSKLQSAGPTQPVRQWTWISDVLGCDPFSDSQRGSNERGLSLVS